MTGRDRIKNNLNENSRFFDKTMAQIAVCVVIAAMFFAVRYLPYDDGLKKDVFGYLTYSISGDDLKNGYNFVKNKIDIDKTVEFLKNKYNEAVNRNEV